MRKISFIVFIALFSFLIVNGQGNYTGPSVESLKKELEKSNEDLEDSDDAKDPKTWLKRGVLMLDIDELGVKGIALGISTSIQVEFELGAPNEKLKETLPDGTQKTIYKYDNVDIYLNQNNIVTGWDQKVQLVENPLKKAVEAFNKAIDYDEKGKMEKKVSRDLDRLVSQISEKARMAYLNENYAKAGEMFALAAQLPNILNNYEQMVDEVVIDTPSYFNAGLSYYGAEMYEEAAEFFTEAARYEYSLSESYNRLYWSYILAEDTINAVAALEKGIKEIPQEINFMLMMIDLQIKMGNVEKAIDFIQEAKKAQPDNEKLYYAEGTLWDQLGKTDKAIDSYENAIEVTPDYHQAYYGIGIVYYYEAKEMFDAAMDLKDNQEYNKAVDKANETLKKSIDYFEKAHELAPEEINYMEYLKALYVRFSMEEKLEDIKAKLGE